MLDDLHLLSKGAYSPARYNLAALAEGQELKAYLDGKKIPTIGVGFNLRAVLHPVALSILGAAWDQTLEDEIAAVVAQSFANKTALQKALTKVLTVWNKTPGHAAPPTFEFATEEQSNALLDGLAPTYEGYVNAWLAGIPKSDERTVLFSLAYNNPVLLGPGLRAAIVDNDRAEAWIQIRYFSNGGGGRNAGVANRRYVEANGFHLYGVDHNPSEEDSISIAQSYAIQRDVILKYEAEFDPVRAAAEKGVPGIQDIYHEMIPAMDILKYVYHVEQDLEELQAASDAKADLRGDHTAFDSDSNDDDFLIGDEQPNKLVGDQGDDVIIGNDGADTLEGGDDDDLLRGGPGADTMRGGDGDDTYEWLGRGDRVIEAPDEGDDTVIIGAPGTVKIPNVEHLKVVEALPGQVKAYGADVIDIGLSDGNDDLWLVIEEIKPGADNVTINTGAGADKVKISGDVNWSDWVFGAGTTKFFHFDDIAPGDRIDLRSFHLVGTVIGTMHDTAVTDGLVLMAPWSVLYLDFENPDFTYLTNNTDDWWIADIHDGDGAPFGPSFIGALDASMFVTGGGVIAARPPFAPGEDLLEGAGGAFVI